ncbi:hypothetical protein ABK046_47710, partial [Streptomyces caeruleatus]
HATVRLRFLLGPGAIPLAAFEGLDQQGATDLSALSNPEGMMEGYLKPKALDILESFLIRFLSRAPR